MRVLRLLCVALAFTALSLPALNGQETKGAAAPIPAQILTAKTVFISNAGGDEWDLYSGGPNRAYNQFYAEMKSWGRYEIVPTPADADVILEIRQPNRSEHTLDEPLRLTIFDPKTHVILWAFTEHIPFANRGKIHDQHFDQALAKLMEDVKTLGGQPAVASEKK
jgi:hypothetical protein